MHGLVHQIQHVQEVQETFGRSVADVLAAAVVELVNLPTYTPSVGRR